MKIVRQNDFRQKVEVIIGALLSYDITREHAIKCLSSVVIVPDDVATSQAIEQAERVMTRHRHNAGIDLSKFPSLGLTELVHLPTGLEELEFQLAFGTEFLPFMTEDVKDRWERMAFDSVTDLSGMSEDNITNPDVRRATMGLSDPEAYETWRAGKRDDALDTPISIEQGATTA